MANSDIKNKALEIAEKYYPEAECVLLTGSQIESEHLTPQSDVDIVLIGSQFIDITSDGLLEGEYKVDFTRIGYYNLYDLFIDFSYHSNPVIIDMLRNGVVLKDKIGIAELAKEQCNSIYLTGSNTYFTDLRNIRLALAKLKKHFRKDLDNIYYRYLLCDFLQLITSFHLFIRDNGWFSNDGFRKVKMIRIKEKESPFLIEITSFVGSFFENIELNRSLAINYIDKYLNCPLTPKTATVLNKRFIVNLNFHKQSHTSFYNDICINIQKHPYLSKYFAYGQNHNYHNIFRNEYSLVFNNHLGGFEELLLLKELHILCQQTNRRILDLIIVNPEYLYCHFSDENVYEKTEDLLSYIHHGFIRTIDSDKKYNHQKAFLYSLVVASTIIKSFGCSSSIIRSLCRLLFFKWIDSSLLQNINYVNITKRTNQYTKNVKTFYTRNKLLFDSIQNEFKNNDFTISENINLNSIHELCIPVINSIKTSSSELTELQLNIISRIEGITIEEKIRLYYLMNLLEILLNSMCLKKESRANFVYVLEQITI